jgi:signal peptidase II
MDETGNSSGRGLSAWVWGPWSRLAFMTALVGLAVDQSNKLWMIAVYRIQDRGQVALTPFLDLVFVKNTGISYNIGSGALPPLALSAFAFVTSIALMVWVARAATGWLMAMSIGLIVGGAIGNAIDRLWLGGVADFYLLHAFGYSWYVFNIADVAIVAGVAGLLYDSFVPNRQGAANAP